MDKKFGMEGVSNKRKCFTPPYLFEKVHRILTLNLLGKSRKDIFRGPRKMKTKLAQTKTLVVMGWNKKGVGPVCPKGPR